MKRIASMGFALGFCMLIQACYTTPCKTQSFYFGEDTITFPISVRTVKRKIQDIKLVSESAFLFHQQDEATKRYYYSLYEEDRFDPDGDDDLEDASAGALNKGIYSYCFYLPDSMHDEAFQKIVQQYGEGYQRNLTIDSPKYVYYVWKLSDCTQLVFSSINSPLSFEAFEAKQKVTFIAFVHRLNDREIDNVVHLGGSIGKPFD